jgi:hypothetical protein
VGTYTNKDYFSSLVFFQQENNETIFEDGKSIDMGNIDKKYLTHWGEGLEEGEKPHEYIYFNEDIVLSLIEVVPWTRKKPRTLL